MPRDVDLEGGIRVTLDDDQLGPDGNPTPETAQILFEAVQRKKQFDTKAAADLATQKTLNKLRLGGEMVGGIVGGIGLRSPAGAAAGRGAIAGLGRLIFGAAPREMAGSIIGSRIGAVPADVGELVLKTGGVLPDTNPEDPGSYAERVARNAALDLVGGRFTAGALKLGQISGKKMLGLDKAAEDIAIAARDYGIHLGISDVSQSKIVQAYQRALGILPLVSKPFRKSAERRLGEVSTSVGRTIPRTVNIDPAEPIESIIDMGVDFTRAAERTGEIYNNRIATLFDDWRALAKSTGTLFRTDSIKLEARRVLDEMDAGATRTTRTNPLTGTTQSRNLPTDRVGKFDTYVRGLEGLPDAIDVNQWQTQLSVIREFAGKASGKQGYDLKRLAQVFHESAAPGNLIGPPEVAEARSLATRTATTLREFMDRPTARKFLKVDENIFTERPFSGVGSKNADEMYKIAFQANSPGALRDLHELVGPGHFKHALRSHLDDAIADSTVIADDGYVRINVNKIRQNLGLLAGQEGSPARRGLGEAFDLLERVPGAMAQGAGAPKIAELNKFLDVLEAATRNGVPNISNYLARRTGLSGKAALLGAMVGSGGGGFMAFGATGGAIGALASLGLMRGIGSIITSPGMLKVATAALSSDSSRQIAATNASILIRHIAQGALTTEDHKPSEAEVNQKVYEITKGAADLGKPRPQIPFPALGR